MLFCDYDNPLSEAHCCVVVAVAVVQATKKKKHNEYTNKMLHHF